MGKTDRLKNMKIKIINGLETFFVRRAVCNIEPTGLHAVFKGCGGDLEEKTIDTVIQYIKLEVQLKSDDERFIHNIKQIKMENT